MKNILMALLGSVLCSTCCAQADGKQALLQVIRQLASRYQSAGPISFDVSYRCAEEKTPHIYFDSLKGRCKMNGSNYWYQLDSTETIRNKDYSIMLFREDKIIYLAKPASISSGGTPLAFPDSTILNNSNFTSRTDRGKAETTISILFSPGLAYKKIEFFVDNNTGFVNRIVSVVQSGMLLDLPVGAAAELAPGFSVVETTFYHYTTGSFGDDVFNSDSYFTKGETGYLAVSPYQAYKVFVSTPNL